MKIRQAKLPREAYNGLTSGLEYYARKSTLTEEQKKEANEDFDIRDQRASYIPRTKYCPVHPQRMIDDKYDVCYHCFIKKNE